MAKRKTRWQTPGVVFQPAVSRGMQRGINQIVDLVSPTLGPQPRVVASERVASRNGLPEVLDDGGTIVRRILELPGREEDVGAMFIRQVLWQLHEKVGDGTATAAVIFRDIYNEGLRCIAAGSNAMRLHHYLEEGMLLIINELSKMTFSLEGKKELAALAETICHDPPMARLMGEIFDIIGAYGRFEIRKGRSRDLEREYIEGMYWDGGLVSRLMYIDQKNLRVDLEEAAILVTDMAVEDPRDLLPVMSVAVKGGVKALVIIAGKLSDACIGLLLRPEFEGKLKTVAVKIPTTTMPRQVGFMQDVAVLTGATPLVKMVDKITSVRLEHLGRARRAWADRYHFGIIGGMGDPRKLRQHITDLRAAFERETDATARKDLQERIGKLMGGAAVLRVGGFAEMEIEARKDLAERTAEAMRAAMREGVVPGGGSALLACRPALRERLEQVVEPEGRAAYRVLLRAVETPTRTMLQNAGHDPSAIMAEIDRAGSGYGFDLAKGQAVDMAEAGILDAAAVLKAAVHSAVSSAALVLTTDAIVHVANAEQQVNP